MSNVNTPLTERQMAILEAMADGETYTNMPLAAKLGYTKNSAEYQKLSWNIDRLKERQMIDSWQLGNGRAFAITPLGRAEIRRAQSEKRLHGGVVLPPSRGLLTDRTEYVPPKAYYRNNGNGHIPSRGIGA